MLTIITVISESISCISSALDFNREKECSRASAQQSCELIRALSIRLHKLSSEWKVKWENRPMQLLGNVVHAGARRSLRIIIKTSFDHIHQGAKFAVLT